LNQKKLNSKTIDFLGVPMVIENVIPTPIAEPTKNIKNEIVPIK